MSGPACGAAVRPGARFCEECGARLGAPEAPPEPRYAAPSGYTPAHLAGRILKDRAALQGDTCHLFAAGYDIRTPARLVATLAAFDRAIGLDRVVACHVNDATAPLGSGLDRHQHIGRGEIGPAAFRALLRHPRLHRVPMVLETPKADTWDRKNLATLRRLRTARPRARR